MRPGVYRMRYTLHGLGFDVVVDRFHRFFVSGPVSLIFFSSSAGGCHTIIRNSVGWLR